MSSDFATSVIGAVCKMKSMCF